MTRDIRYNIKKVKNLKKKYTKLGARSIHDIVYNTPDMKFVEKVNYIRHHYTYYEGNYDLFHTSEGKPNSLKHALNNIIGKIINKQKDPSALTTFNKKILELRKVIKKPDENTLLIHKKKSNTLPKWIKDLDTNYNENNLYVCLIKKYLANCEEAKALDLDLVSYRQLKELALTWDETLPESEFTQIKEEKRILKVMRAYAKDRERQLNENKQK